VRSFAIRSIPAALAVAALALVTDSAHAQSEVAIEVGASQVRPPLGVEGATAGFLVGGIRASMYRLSGAGVSASFLAGRATDGAAGGDFISTALSGLYLMQLGGGWSSGFEARAFGFDVRAPFPYRAVAVEGGPEVRYSGRASSVRLRGTAGTGRSRVELHRRGERVLFAEDDLWRLGGSAEALFGSSQVMGGFSGGVHRTAGGTYTTGGARAVWAGPFGAAELRVDVWRTPIGTESTGGLAFVIPVGSWSLRGFAGRSEPDPLTLAEAGGGSGGVLLGRSLLRRGPAFRATAPLYEVLDSSGREARVRISVAPPGMATNVELLGDFTGWGPVPMAVRAIAGSPKST